MIELNRLEFGIGVAAFAIGLFELFQIIAGLYSLNGPQPIAQIIAVQSIITSVLTLWFTSIAGVALMVDGFYRSPPQKIMV